MPSGLRVNRGLKSRPQRLGGSENNSIKVASRASEAQSPVGDNNGLASIGSSETPSTAQLYLLTVYLKTQRQNNVPKKSTGLFSDSVGQGREDPMISSFFRKCTT